MNGKKLMRLIAVCAACLSIGVFAFSGCKKKQPGDSNDKDGITADTEDKTGSDTENNNTSSTDNNTSSSDKTDDKTDDKSDDKTDDKTEDKKEETVITGPVAGGPTITKYSEDEFETAFVEWTAADNAKWYNVYCKPASGGDWSRLDAPLIRQYSGYYRADAVGLKAGSYDVKVVPVSGAGEEAAQYAATARNISVIAHDRSGYAFVDGTSSGAYNEDGTLRSGAKVIYITENTKNTVSLTVNTGKNNETFTGLQNILTGFKKATVPLSVRLIGNITDPQVLAKGDVLIDGAKGGITFEGIGRDATANGWGLRIKGASNVEVRNLGFMNCNSGEGDDVGLQQTNDHIWVHNCDFFYGDAGSDADQVKGDGALDTKKSSYVTHSYNRFHDTGKSNLQGMKSEKTTNYITYHHNWYDHSDSRHPRIRTCTVHIYNNYFDGIAKYGVGVTMGASAFVENNYFRSTATLRPMLSSGQGTDALGEGTFSGEAGGIIKSFGNKYDCTAANLKLITQKNAASAGQIDCYEVSSRNEKVPDTVKTVSGGTTYSNFDTDEEMYEYSVDTADEAKAKVEKYAGRLEGGDLVWNFDNQKEDPNYSVIKELKAALVAYKSGLVKVDDEKITASTGGGSVDIGGDEEEGDDEGGGTTGGGSLAGNVTKIEFKKENDGKYPAGITVDANYNSKTGYIKMESSSKITITVSEGRTVTIHTDTGNKKIKINGSKVDLNGNGEYTVTLSAGETLIIEKGDKMDLQYVSFG